MKSFPILFPWIVLISATVWLGVDGQRPADLDGRMQVQACGRLPVVHHGRIKPLDTLARTSLVIISQRQTFLDSAGEQRPAIDWLLDVISGSPASMRHKVFRIENFQVQEILGLQPRLEPVQQKYRYALEEFADQMPVLDRESNVAHRKRAQGKKLDVYETKVVELAEKLQLYLRLRESHRFPMVRTTEELQEAVQQYRRISEEGDGKPAPLPHLVPPAAAGESWRPFTQAALLGIATGQSSGALEPLALMLNARATNNLY